jgi:hypothetical protein
MSSAERPAFPQPATDAEQHEETDGTWPVIGTGPMTSAQARGAVFWGLLIAFIGAMVGLLVSIIPFADLLWAGRAALLGGIGALAGATAGFIYGGGREAELEEDVGNQIGAPGLTEVNRDPEPARRAVEAKLRSDGRSPQP